MTDTLYVRWTLSPDTPPQPIRHCSSCKVTRPFQSSGKVRLNANGKRLDAWLIYRCSVCERTWNHTLLERASLQMIAETDLYAMEHSSPDWVRVHEQDIPALKRNCDGIIDSENVVVSKPGRPSMLETPAIVELTLVPEAPTGQRLDRVLAQELSLSRSSLKALSNTGKLDVQPAGPKALSKKIASKVAVVIRTDAFTEAEAAQVLFNLFDKVETDRVGRMTGPTTGSW